MPKCFYLPDNMFGPTYRRATEASISIPIGEFLDELGAEEVFLALIGMCMPRNQIGWQRSVERPIDTLITGLEVG